MRQKELLVISIGVFMTILAWMIFDIYHIQTQEVTQREVRPVQVSNYNINVDIFGVLEQKTP